MGVVKPTLSKIKNRLPWKINPSPIFILGNQKSGTSAIAGLLGEATGLTTTIDIRGIYEPVQSRLHSGTLSFDTFVKRNKLDFSRTIIKEPSLTLFVKQLDRFFDHPKYVFVVRDPRQNIRSILNRIGLPGDEQEFDEEELARKVVNWSGWKRVIDGRWLGITHNDYISALAARWNFMVNIFEENRHRFILTRYETFLDDRVYFIDKLANDLSLRARYDIQDKIERQYQPRGDNSVTPLEFFGPNNLSRIEKICGASMKKLGY